MELLTHRNENKTKEYTYYIKDGEKVKHGLCRDWSITGHLYHEGYYKDGKAHGLIRSWYENGQLEGKLNYKDGERHGFCRNWEFNGKLELEIYYWEGVKYESQEAYEESLIANKSW